MGFITAMGDDAVAQVKNAGVDMKEAYIRLKKEGESVTVRVLSLKDIISFLSHGDYKKGIYGTPCLKPTGVECPFCVAHKNGGESWKGLYQKKRIVFAFGVLESGDVRLLDVSTTQAEKLMADINEYADEITAGEIAFNLVRTGADMSTAYALKPLTPKKLEAVKAQFKAFDGVTVDADFYDARIIGKTPEYMVKLLADAAFPVERYFSPEMVAASQEHGDNDTVVTVAADTEDEADII